MKCYKKLAVAKGVGTLYLGNLQQLLLCRYLVAAFLFRYIDY